MTKQVATETGAEWETCPPGQKHFSNPASHLLPLCSVAPSPSQTCRDHIWKVHINVQITLNV